MQPKLEVDIAIIGGGMVGASLAAVLPATFSVALVESFALPDTASLAAQQTPPSFDSRTTALSKSSEHILRKAGVWLGLMPDLQSIQAVHVSDKGRWGSVLLTEAQESMDQLGYVIENAKLGRALLAQIASQAHIHCLSPATVDHVVVQQQGALLHCTTQQQPQDIKAKLVIIADGARSNICQQLGIHISHYDYGHQAIVCNIATDSPHQNIAYERFTEDGPMALLPMLPSSPGEHRSALIWTLPNAKAERLSKLNEQEFLSELHQNYGSFQGNFCRAGKRSNYPLSLSTADEQLRNHMVVMGNAAHSLHPVAGQGFNLAVRDVAALVQVSEEAAALNQAWYKLDVLENYLKKHQQDQWLTIAFSDMLPDLFANPSAWMKPSRAVSLMALELLPSIKSRFVNFATGYR